jgi:hypothetical protein
MAPSEREATSRRTLGSRPHRWNCAKIRCASVGYHDRAVRFARYAETVAKYDKHRAAPSLGAAVARNRLPGEIERAASANQSDLVDKDFSQSGLLSGASELRMASRTEFVVPYLHSSRGAYFAAGALIRSTLATRQRYP